ncbi:MAG: cytochrome c3 family protein [Planctomycetota bacterium]|jgi:predicted CXXCH cytochrome family protein
MQVTFDTALIAGAIGLGSWVTTATADITSSAHDFASYGWSEGEVCKPCHTPHFADTSVGYLWSHEMSSLTYTLFDGSLTDPGGVDALDQYTRMCLSCHDGSVALDSYHGNAGTVYIDDAYKVGGDGNLADDHPIGVPGEYDVAGSPGRFNAATLSGSGFWGFGPGYFPEIPLFPFDPGSGEIQVVSCSTCHSPHGVPGVDSLLRKSNAASDLCLTCHIK